MELYTLDDTFLKSDSIDAVNSVIWTERYLECGEVILNVPATEANKRILREDTFLASSESSEVMLIETVLVEKGQLILSGNTLDKFLDNRSLRTSPTYGVKAWRTTGVPGWIMGEVVLQTAVNGSLMTDANGVGGATQRIPNLTVGTRDATGVAVTQDINFGPVYEIIKALAETFQVGFRLYLAGAAEGTYSLVFTTYTGKDRTSAQTVNEIVRFSPALDSIADAKELRSVAGYKNVAYAFAPAYPTLTTSNGKGTAFANAAASAAVGFKRRVLQVLVDDVQTDPALTTAQLLAILNQKAKDALANNNYARIFDGEVVPQSEFKYGTHYGLGDIIELSDTSGYSQRARVTEYIRSEDSGGARAYPTITVLD